MAQGVHDLACLGGGTRSIPGPEQWVKDPALPQLGRKSQLPLGRKKKLVGLSCVSLECVLVPGTCEPDHMWK